MFFAQVVAAGPYSRCSRVTNYTTRITYRPLKMALYRKLFKCLWAGFC